MNGLQACKPFIGLRASNSGFPELGPTDFWGPFGGRWQVDPNREQLLYGIIGVPQ